MPTVTVSRHNPPFNCRYVQVCVTPERVLRGLQQYTMEAIAVASLDTSDIRSRSGSNGSSSSSVSNNSSSGFSSHDVVHTHRVVPGSATSSYAMHVAKMAGLPDSVCKRAQELLQRFEQ